MPGPYRWRPALRWHARWRGSESDSDSPSPGNSLSHSSARYIPYDGRTVGRYHCHELFVGTLMQWRAHHPHAHGPLYPYSYVWKVLQERWRRYFDMPNPPKPASTDLERHLFDPHFVLARLMRRCQDFPLSRFRLLTLPRRKVARISVRSSEVIAARMIAALLSPDKKNDR